jgi:hypothetical protein
LVGVFDPEDEVAAMTAGKEVVVEGGPYAAEVKAPGGAGGKSQTYFLLIGCEGTNPILNP